ncbi:MULTISPECIES: FGGY-family carbohydrate kinase [unclassified Bosea (in: a-proteobacteria)]|uniref:FGGY-family carbohydrate kinase n=1 Tax=unclassified Bosea (in: a-proteobacteria) TaxID=2653178 RepID=UPI000F74DFF1|nr:MULTISPECIES: FGGY-family carbohydrate kinase [unclassified Bosea (in: a-proteobacteria)]AZO78205.1 ribulokinase [Bosea sp. Tri-49]
MAGHFIGIDVGTGSARAGIFDRAGRMVATAKRDIALYRDGPDIAEQSSEDIWQAVCASVREAMVNAGLSPDAIAGIGFDATCSLVAVGQGGAPLPVGSHGDASRDIIVWMDHRAIEQAERINATRHPVLAYVGGTISPEMETPKLLWLKQKLPSTYDAAWQFFDLPDFLTWRASGSLARSTCTVTCKWTYLAHEGRWDAGFFHQIGLADLADEGFARIGTEIVPGGTALGQGLTGQAAAELGLKPGTAVAAGLIDAHAGGVGSVGVRSAPGSALTRMAYVFGTSACTMASSREPIFIPGVWGPYFAAMAPGLWLNEGGQSGAGAAIEQLIGFHPATPDAQRRADAEGLSLPDWLAAQALQHVDGPSEAARLAGELIVVPDFLGNRSPHADPQARAVISGLGMERDLNNLVALYVAGLTGIGYGLRQIIEVSRAQGAIVEAIVLSGGAGRHPLIRQLLADCSGRPVLVPDEVNPVLLGSAMLAAAAAKAFTDLGEAMTGMAPCATVFTPAGGEIARLHTRRLAAFEALQAAARQARELMRPARTQAVSETPT